MESGYGRQASRLGRWLVLVLVLVMLSACRNLLFHPTRQMVTSPTDWGLAYKDVELTSSDGTVLHGWWLPAVNESARGTVYFLHGNAENISTHIASVAWLPAEGFNVFLLDYRGYGQSSGKAELEGIFRDIDAGMQWLNTELNETQPLIVLGQSLGASMGGYVVASRWSDTTALAAVILDAAFSSYRRIAREVASSSWLTKAFSPLAVSSMPEEYDLVDVIGRLAPKPLLLIHGNHDEVIPVAHVETLFAAAEEPKSLLRYDGPHIATFGDRENRQLLVGFIDRALERWRNTREH